MEISHLKQKIKSFYKLFIAPPKNWRLPSKCEVLIYDVCGSDVLQPYLENYRVTKMAVRGESINMPSMACAILSSEFWKGRHRNAYVESFVKLASPKIVITFIDNDEGFYRISKSCSFVKTIFLQNGTRGESGDIFSRLTRSDKYHVDYMLVHGEAIGLHYSKYLSGQFISIGCLKNNSVASLNEFDADTVLFVSQLSSKPLSGKVLYFEHDGSPVYCDQFYAAELKILNFLDKWCAKNNKKLRICGREQHDYVSEKQFYAEQLTSCVWEYIPRVDNFSSYRLVDNAEIVVFVDSTVGYESIGRGKKTAAFSCRGQSIFSKAANFGWPLDLPNNGPFWTNDQDESQFQRIMDYLSVVNDEDWEKARLSASRQLIDFNPGNTRFIRLLDQLLSVV